MYDVLVLAVAAASGWKLRESAPKRKERLIARRKNDARRSTPLSLQTPVILTSLDPGSAFHEVCKTAFVNAHGCAMIVRERLADETPVRLKLVSNGANKEGRVVLAVPLLESVSWLLGVEFDSPGNFWGVENPPADWDA